MMSPRPVRWVTVSAIVCCLLTGTNLPSAWAELRELDVRTLEYAAEIARIRSLALQRPLRTIRWSKAQVRRGELAPAQALAPLVHQDHGLHRALGVVDSPRAAEPSREPWLAWFPAFYSAGEPGQVVLLPRKRGGERQRLAHRLAVHVAILDQNVGGGLAGASVDHQLARQALLWGDAYLSWLALGTVPQHGDVSQRVQWAEEQLRDRLGRPPRRSDSFLRRLAWQVLQQGVRAAATVRDTSPWRALDDMYRNGLPRSTAQVLHPTWLLEDRRARTVEISPLELFANVAPGGPPQQGQVGELRLRLWLEKYLSADVAYNATAGWAGDAYQLYPNARGAEGRELLVLASAWDMTGETTAEQEAQEFAEAVGLAMDQLAGDRLPGGTGAPTGAVRWRTAAGQGILVEQRGDQVLVVMHCPSDSFDQAGPHIWSNVQVGRLDLSPLVDEDAQITTPIAPVEPAPPWYRRTPGVVALVLWLFVLLPGLCVALTRRGGKGRKELARLYLRGLALTVAIVFIIWLTGR